MSVTDRLVGLSLYPTGTRPKGDGMELSPFQPPLSVGHLPQMRQVKFGMRSGQLNRRICPYRMLREGRLGDGSFSVR